MKNTHTLSHTLTLLSLTAMLVACSEKAPTAPSTAAPASAPVDEYVAPNISRPTTLTAALKPTGHCSIDMVNYAVAAPSNTVTDKTKVKLQGWAADATQGLLPQQVYLELEGAQKMWVRAVTGTDRPDVATHFKNPQLQNAGWSAFANLSTLPAGTYTLRVVQIMNDHSETLCETQRKLVLP